MTHRWILPNIKKNVTSYPSQTIIKKLKRMVPISFYKVIITLIPKSDKGITKEKRKLQDSIPGEYRCKNSQQNVSQPNTTLQ